jgi:hypothetical protein
MIALKGYRGDGLLRGKGPGGGRTPGGEPREGERPGKGGAKMFRAVSSSRPGVMTFKNLKLFENYKISGDFSIYLKKSP